MYEKTFMGSTELENFASGPSVARARIKKAKHLLVLTCESNTFNTCINLDPHRLSNVTKHLNVTSTRNLFLAIL